MFLSCRICCSSSPVAHATVLLLESINKKQLFYNDLIQQLSDIPCLWEECILTVTAECKIKKQNKKHPGISIKQTSQHARQMERDNEYNWERETIILHVHHFIWCCHFADWDFWIMSKPLKVERRKKKDCLWVISHVLPEEGNSLKYQRGQRITSHVHIYMLATSDIWCHVILI